MYQQFEGSLQLLSVEKHIYHVCMLDAFEAFDRVHYDKLFDLLRKRQLPATVIRLLLDIYTTQRMRGVWNGSASVCLTIENGVRQGSILSPILCCAYIDELLNCLTWLSYKSPLLFCLRLWRWCRDADTFCSGAPGSFTHLWNFFGGIQSRVRF